MTAWEKEKLRLKIAAILEGMVPSIFTEEMLLTFVARHSSKPDCFVVVTNDPSPAEVAHLLEWHGV